MAWKVEVKKNSKKFLDQQNSDTQNRIRQSIRKLIDYLDNGILPFSDMDIKKLRGRKQDSFRLRIGNIRIIFTLIISAKLIRIENIDYRGDAYK